MAIRNIAKYVFKRALLALALSVPSYGNSAPQLPEPELSWKNVAVDSKKQPYFVVSEIAGD